jgi:hypothetical protein
MSRRRRTPRLRHERSCNGSRCLRATTGQRPRRCFERRTQRRAIAGRHDRHGRVAGDLRSRTPGRGTRSLVDRRPDAGSLGYRTVIVPVASELSSTSTLPSPSRATTTTTTTSSSCGDPLAHAGDVNEGEVVPCRLLEACRDRPESLEVVKDDLDEVELAVERPLDRDTPSSRRGSPGCARGGRAGPRPRRRCRPRRSMSAASSRACGPARASACRRTSRRRRARRS